MTIFNKIGLFEFFISQLSLNPWKIGIFNIEKELIFRTHIVLLGNIRLLWKRWKKYLILMDYRLFLFGTCVLNEICTQNIWDFRCFPCKSMRTKRKPK